MIFPVNTEELVLLMENLNLCKSIIEETLYLISYFSDANVHLVILETLVKSIWNRVPRPRVQREFNAFHSTMIIYVNARMDSLENIVKHVDSKIIKHHLVPRMCVVLLDNVSRFHVIIWRVLTSSATVLEAFFSRLLVLKSLKSSQIFWNIF